ncbi:hypothetical protein [Pseudonocardia zijingensis]|uniref:Uncharacterized protein n=1 Tax=Pseudonocardia zijingensis TaxID=153376 RepID=A0ABN1P5U2_9PSEU
MSDGPQECALPGCAELVEQPDDGGPRRLYCSPAHRAAARKMRHAARMEAATEQPAEQGSEEQTTQLEQPSEEQTTELPAALGTPRPPEPEPEPVPEREWSPAAAWSVTPPTLPPASSVRTVRTITSKRVKKQKPALTAADRKNAATHMRRRAIASVAIASLVAGGASYFVTENVVPSTPTTLPPQAAPQPSMDADVWAEQAQVVLASLGSQLDAVAQAEASWLSLPPQRRAQEPAAVQALKERKALLEQQRTTLTSQLEALRKLPERTSELTSAQAQLDAVERTLKESTTTAASPDYQEALRQLESQRDMHRQQRDYAAQALTDLRNGVEQALASPLPAQKDETAPIVERVKAVVEGRPDPGEKNSDKEHTSNDDQDPVATQRREDGDEERGDVGTTAPPDPERPNTPDILADGGRDAQESADGARSVRADNADDNGAANNGADSDGGDRGPVQSIAGALGSALGQSDTSNRDERANRRALRAADGSDESSAGESAGTENGDERSEDRSERSERRGGGLGNVLGGVTGGLLGGGKDRGEDRSEDRKERRDDDKDDRDRDRDKARDDDRDHDRDDDKDDRDDHKSWWSDRDDRDDDEDRDERSSRHDRDDDDDDDEDDDDRGVIRGISDGLLGDDDDDRKRPHGKAERQRDKERNASEERGGEHADKDDDDKDEHADEDRDEKRPQGKAERERHKDRGGDKDSGKKDGGKKGSGKKKDSDNHDDDDKDDDGKKGSGKKKDSDKHDDDDKDDDGKKGSGKKKDSDKHDDDDKDDDGKKSSSKKKDSDKDDGDGGDSDGGDDDGGDDD